MIAKVLFVVLGVMLGFAWFNRRRIKMHSGVYFICVAIGFILISRIPILLSSRYFALLPALLIPFAVLGFPFATDFFYERLQTKFKGVKKKHIATVLLFLIIGGSVGKIYSPPKRKDYLFRISSVIRKANEKQPGFNPLIIDYSEDIVRIGYYSGISAKKIRHMKYNEFWDKLYSLFRYHEVIYISAADQTTGIFKKNQTTGFVDPLDLVVSKEIVPGKIYRFSIRRPKEFLKKHERTEYIINEFFTKKYEQKINKSPILCFLKEQKAEYLIGKHYIKLPIGWGLHCEAYKKSRRKVTNCRIESCKGLPGVDIVTDISAGQPHLGVFSKEFSVTDGSYFIDLCLEGDDDSVGLLSIILYGNNHLFLKTIPVGRFRIDDSKETWYRIPVSNDIFNYKGAKSFRLLIKGQRGKITCKQLKMYK